MTIELGKYRRTKDSVIVRVIGVSPDGSTVDIRYLTPKGYRWTLRRGVDVNQFLRRHEKASD